MLVHLGNDVYVNSNNVVAIYPCGDKFHVVVDTVTGDSYLTDQQETFEDACCVVDTLKDKFNGDYYDKL